MSVETCVGPETGALIPWYVIGTLSEEERRSAEEHLAVCPMCRHEAAMLRGVACALEQPSPRPQSDLYAETLKRLRPRGWRRVIDDCRGWLAPLPTYGRVALVAQAVIILVLAAFLGGRSAFTTLSETSDQFGAGADLQVVFGPQATVRQIQDLLQPLGARIVDGPSSMGVYSVLVPVGPEHGAATADSAAQQLRASPLVQFAGVIQPR